MANLFASSCLFTHQAGMEQHHYSFELVFQLELLEYKK